jgi:hypothetical protein
MICPKIKGDKNTNAEAKKATNMVAVIKRGLSIESQILVIIG